MKVNLRQVVAQQSLKTSRHTSRFSRQRRISKGRHKNTQKQKKK